MSWNTRETTRLLPFALFMLFPHAVLCNWMYLGVSSAGLSTTSHTCNMLPGLVYQQMRVCQENPQAIPCVSLGAKLGIYECSYQFKYERWNCTTHQNPSVFGQVMQKGTRETAFIYAITSAGVVHAVTTACSAGNLTDCSCDLTRQGMTSAEGWKWGGCSDNIDYGTWFARTFVDAPEKLKYATTKEMRSLINMHNNEAGRQVMSEMMNRKCRCHGVSGSCAVKTCWKTLPHFREIGQKIKKKYENSVQVAHRSSKKLRPRDKRMRRTPITDMELVYLDASPNYCRQNLRKGILGTRGRDCKKDTRGPDSCDMLCCGRGYNTVVVRTVERCHCKFVWCCEVKCKTCETLTDIHTCK